MPFLYHNAVGAGLPPLLLHRHTTSSPSFTLRGFEQLVIANGCAEKKETRHSVCSRYSLVSKETTDAHARNNNKLKTPYMILRRHLII